LLLEISSRQQARNCASTWVLKYSTTGVQVQVLVATRSAQTNTHHSSTCINP